jgi:hypothetical protein
MKPGDHPDFFRLPAPEGRSRESTIRLDSQGRFWHQGALVEHGRLAAALHGWIGRHPDDGRYILTNGYDWTYFTVDDASYFVQRVHVEPERLVLVLSDGTEEAWEPEASRTGEGGALYTLVKRGAKGGPYEAKFSRHAQAALGPILEPACGEAAEPAGATGGGAPENHETSGPVAVKIGGRIHGIGAKNPSFG